MGKPKITVIIPAYNIENLITRCVESVVNQTYPKELTQIIVVDDGSTDNTGKIIDELASKYDNVTALHEENGGSSKARNYALSKAEGDFIGFVDSDDYVEPFMYEKLVDALVRNNALMAQTGRDEIAEDGSKLPNVVEVPQWETIYTDKGFLKELLMHKGDASFCTKLTARSLFDIDGRLEESVKENSSDGSNVRLFPEGVLNEDFWLLYHMLPDVREVVVTTDTGYHVFYRSGSNSRKKAEDKDYFPRVFTDIVVNSDEVTAFARDKYPDLSEYTMRFSLVQRLDYLLHIPISKMTKDNAFYQDVCRFVKEHKKEIKTNPYLSRRQRLYLYLFTSNARTVRVLHAKIRGL
ncbi:Glycosyl transferase family 2 [Butyrivibrio fibrisolvens DSM 3071]|uniref:Glycosyl transferase family 2 n=1 Tax=Butyrivibrio fibrisolvens DSM 3071 TaxID=1121131 RepID=A0A1M5XWM0_BUTFI|nr:glycosyltransferase family 2 protein [Butyrivibrio fibrisolvens]SHI04122.1 Glycosyl transferase family 2 [Butyrivibrio fibrisolvens DSM 3071]